MDRLDAMAILLAVVDAGSLSAAARKLRMPLATVSRRIADLESHLRAKLMLRTRRGTELTEAGLAYLEASRRILEQVEEAERIAAGEYSAPRGELRVTAPTLFGQRHVLPVTLAFLEENPEISLSSISKTGRSTSPTSISTSPCGLVISMLAGSSRRRSAKSVA